MEDKPMRTLQEVIGHHAEQRGELVLYRELDSRGQELSDITFAEFHRRTQSVARYLLNQGDIGQSIILLFPPGIEFMVAFAGVVLAGKIAVPTARLGAVGFKRSLPRLQRIAQNCAAQTILVDTAFLADLHVEGAQQWLPEQQYRYLPLPVACDDLPIALPAASLDTVAYLQYSSGSTGAPKGVMITHRNMAANTAVIEDRMGNPGRVVSVEWMPHFHDYSLVKGLLLALYTGSKHVILPSMTILRAPLVWLNTVSRYRAWRSGGPNFAYQQCVDRISEADAVQLDLSHWRWAHCGAEPIKAATIEAFLRRFAVSGLSPRAFHPAYGMAETTLLITCTRPGQHWRAMPVRPGDRQRLTVSCGAPCSGMEIRIVDPERQYALPEREVGEIWVSTNNPSISPGYWHEEEINRETFQARLDGVLGRFMRTGDLGYLDAGELTVSGRIKDLIIYQGRNIVPTDIEWLAQTDRPWLRKDCGAAFSMDDSLSDRLVLVQEVDKRCPPDCLPGYVSGIQQELAQQLGVRLDDILFIRTGSLPKTSSGKIQRRECRSLLLQGALPVLHRYRSDMDPDVASSDLRGSSLGYLVRLLAMELDRPLAQIDPYLSLFDLGMDSRAIVHFHEVLRSRRPEWELDITDLFQYASLGRLAEHIEASAAQAQETVAPLSEKAGPHRNRRRIPDIQDI
ncbi:AMP-binding protein [Verminephrobacter aporrectodeae subsp. tuberculatae]|uniref:AMP-binding protein n=1 Tax=Verminephrobacter aporrectodeae TaxID=1110389 RepID=UPI0022448976|nr:AMP-binding protein [Verminephrobacter aporrectodeae]MCW8205654.1 AMP-binding protein [Verminephrobacter aporrectodeae subsp. tuberculatae]